MNNNINYSFALNPNDYTWKNALLWGNCVAHYRRAQDNNRYIHYTIAAVEAIPLLGQIVSIFEKLIMQSLLKGQSPADLQDKQIIPIGQAGDSFLFLRSKHYMNSFVSLALCIALYAAVVFPLDAKQTAADNTPIIFVHGYFHNQSAWLYIRHRLLKAGLGNIFPVNLGTIFHSMEEYSQVLKVKAEEVARITGRTDVIFICHSMGGVVAKHYAKNVAPSNTVKDIIALGSPYNGTKAAYIGLGACARQMIPGSEFLTQLHAEDSETDNIPYLCMGSETDLLIQPQGSALHGHPKADRLVFPFMGHLEYLFSSEVADAIIHRLQSSRKPVMEV